MDIIKELYNYGLVPVIKITDVNNAVPLAKALADGGLNCAEITFRTACAKEAIAKITDPGWKMYIPLIICAIGNVILGLFSQPLVQFFMDIAAGKY